MLDAKKMCEFAQLSCRFLYFKTKNKIKNTHRKDAFLGNLSCVLSFWVGQNGGSTCEHVKFM